MRFSVIQYVFVFGCIVLFVCIFSKMYVCLRFWQVKLAPSLDTYYMYIFNILFKIIYIILFLVLIYTDSVTRPKRECVRVTHFSRHGFGYNVFFLQTERWLKIWLQRYNIVCIIWRLLGGWDCNKNMHCFWKLVFIVVVSMCCTFRRPGSPFDDSVVLSSTP